MDTEIEDRKKEGYPQSRQRQEEGTVAQEETENTHYSGLFVGGTERKRPFSRG